jgi:hypothetical protein
VQGGGILLTELAVCGAPVGTLRWRQSPHADEPREEVRMVAHLRPGDHGRVDGGASPIPSEVTVEVALLDQAIQVGLDRRVRQPAPESPAVQEYLVNGAAGG